MIPALGGTGDEILDLAGRWTASWNDQIHRVPLPGSLQASRLGAAISVETPWTGGIFDRSYFDSPDYAEYRRSGAIKVPFWLQPETHFVGEARYERSVEFPSAWLGRRVVLELERPHWKTTVCLDGRLIGSNDSLSCPHCYDLGLCEAPGPHALSIVVDNRLDPDIGENSHSVSDHTQGNWNGIVGRIQLRATAPVWIDSAQVTSDIIRRRIEIRGRLSRLAGYVFPVVIHASSGGAQVTAPIGSDGSYAVELVLDSGAPLWDEFTPAAHSVTLGLENGERRTVTFGLREIRARGRELLINGRKLFLRGTLDCAAFPRTGHPPMTEAEWSHRFAIVKDHGLNHVRFHSWCPPECAFAAADALGLYLQIEVASWPNWSTTLGDGKPVDAWTDAETTRILEAYGNHPSFVMLCAGNEPGGDNHARWLSGWVARQKAADPRRLYTSGAGWPEVPENDYHIRSEPRIQHWEEGLASRINANPPETRTDYRDFVRERNVPVISHEIGQWCAYPNLNEIPKYTGYLKPRNFEIFKTSLEQNHLGSQARNFLMASGKLQALCYKEEIESALRTPSMGGFQLLGLSDFPGQGTAPVGVLDAFWEEKGYQSPAEFRRFCSGTVPLVRLAKRVFTTEGHLQADVELAHFGAAPLVRIHPRWRLTAESGQTIAEGLLDSVDVPVGAGTRLGRIDLALASVVAPARYRLLVAIDEPAVENGWDVWVYPPAPEVDTAPPDGVMIARGWSDDVGAHLAGGGIVVLMLPPAQVAPDPRRGQIALGFSSVFWNTAWTKGQAPHTLGIFCSPSHPALRRFPTEAWSDWQWWYPVSHAAPMILDGMSAELMPIVQVIDDWFTNRKLALAFEARVGSGRLLVTSIELEGGELDPVRRQLRSSLLAYVSGPQFQPTVEVSPAQIRSVVTS